MHQGSGLRVEGWVYSLRFRVGGLECRIRILGFRFTLFCSESVWDLSRFEAYSFATLNPKPPTTN